MAEVFGAVASAVALLHLSTKAARVLRGISDIEDDFGELCKEIEAINRRVDYAKSKIPSVAPVIQWQLEETAGRLKNIAKDLEKLEDDVTRKFNDGSFKVKKTKWLTEAGKVAKLLEKARNAKDDLSSAILWQQTAQLDRIEEVTVGILQHSVRSEQIISMARDHLMILADKFPPSELQPEKQQNRVEELPDTWTETDEKDESLASGTGINEIPVDGADSGGYTRRDSVARVDTSLTPSRSAVLSTTLADRMKPSCPENCRCGCHTNVRASQKTGPMNSLLGYLGVHLDTPSWGGKWDARCKCRGSWNMEYRPPWLRARVLMLSVSCYAAGPQVTLRAARVVPLGDSIWHDVGQSAQRLRYLITRGTVVYPDDRSEGGLEIIERVIAGRHYEVLELLLMEWRNVLPAQGLSKRAGWAANSVIENSKGTELGETQLSLLQQVLSVADPGDGPATSRVHVAAMQGRGMAEALAQDGWAKDMIDSIGKAPLHVAIDYGQVGDMQQLIDAGADVNIQDRLGLTPLISAARYNNTDMMRRLLVAGGRIDQRDFDGMTLLHWAAYFRSVDAVRLILGSAKGRALAIAIEPDLGRRPLHEVAFSLGEGASPEAIGETARLLLDADPQGIEARDHDGDTPLFDALNQDNLPLVRCLVQAGASLDVCSSDGSNLLHHAGGWSSAATLDFLLEGLQNSTGTNWQLSHIDHQLRNKYGKTPWDRFIFAMHAPPWRTRFHRDSRSQYAFINFYKHIRDKNIRHDISILKNALDALAKDNIDAACHHLFCLAAHKANSHNEKVATWYRAFAKQLQAGDGRAAVLGIEQDIEDLDDELQSSPWDQVSDCDYLASESQWVELPNNSFWVEPAGAFVREKSTRQPARDKEGRDTQQTDPLEDGPESAPAPVHLDYDRITQIYSDRAELLYSRGVDQYGPLEFFRQHLGDTTMERPKIVIQRKERLERVGTEDE